MIRFQHLSSINAVVAEANGDGDRVVCYCLLTNLFPYDDGTSLPNESPVALSTMDDIDEDEGVEGELANSKAGPYQLDCIYKSLADDPSRNY